MARSKRGRFVFAMLPCYNEEDNIVALIEKWVKLSPALQKRGYSLLVYCVDDKSTDGTNGVIKRASAKYPSIVDIIEHKDNKGLGGVVMTALRFFDAVGEDGDLLVLMDGDNTHDPIFTLDMLDRIESGADCVIASRYRAGAKTNGVPAIRLLMSWGARVFYTAVLHVDGVRDYTCGYRMYKHSIVSEALKSYGNSLVEQSSFACMMELLYKISLMGVRFDEVPFQLHYEAKQGESKMRIANTIVASSSTAIKLRRQRNAFISEIK